MSVTDLAFEFAYQGKTDNLRDLIRGAGVDPNARHQVGGQTILQAACQENHAETVAMLLESGADPNLEFTLRDLFADRFIYRDATALSSTESVDVAALLMEFGAEIDHADAASWTPVVHAATSLNIDLVSFFIQKGAQYPMLEVAGKPMPLLAMMKEERRRVSKALGKKLTPKQERLMDRYDAIIELLGAWEAKS